MELVSGAEVGGLKFPNRPPDVGAGSEDRPNAGCGLGPKQKIRSCDKNKHYLLDFGEAVRVSLVGQAVQMELEVV